MYNLRPLDDASGVNQQTEAHTYIAMRLMCCQHCFCMVLQFEDKHHSGLLKMVADQLQCSPADIVDFELNVCDTQDGVIGGRLHRRLPDHSPVLLCLFRCTQACQYGRVTNG